MNITAKQLTEMYYHYLKTFEINGSKTYTYLEFINWLHAASPINPYKDNWSDILSDIHAGVNSSRVDSAKGVAAQWRKKFIALASRCVEERGKMEDTLIQTIDPEGNSISVYTTNIIDSEVPILPEKWRREIYFDRSAQLWVISPLGSLITKDQKGRDTVTQEVMAKATTAIKKHQKRNKRATEAGALGDLHVSCQRMAISIRGLEDKQMTDHLQVFKQLLDSDVDAEIDELKETALEHSTLMKEKDQLMKQKDAEIEDLKKRLGLPPNTPLNTPA